MKKALIAQARENFHKNLIESKTLSFSNFQSGKLIASNADIGNRTSVEIATSILNLISLQQHIDISECKKASGQTLGKLFEKYLAQYIQETFLNLGSIRPGKWQVKQMGNRSTTKISDFAQYEHLEKLEQATQKDPTLLASLGNDYFISPDIIIFRELYEDQDLNQVIDLVDNKTCLKTDLRKINGGKPILHASISAKFTMRSDRAQNSRTESLNLIRNRKGHLPHIVIVTAEPTPGRLASLALGTGDLDCVYHFALYELEQSVNELASDDSKEMLKTLIEGKRLKDISDLPLDLAV